MGLFEELNLYKNKNIYPMHMPGHKRNLEWSMDSPYGIDITEIEGFDNLGRPQGILAECMNRASAIYRCSASYLLVNGATTGILTAVSAMTKQGDTILIMRNSHMSVYNAAYINKLCIQYIYPEVINDLGILGGITPELVEEKLMQFPRTSLVIITSPTYEGIISDVQQIADIVHKHNIPLLVDSSHGAHLGFYPDFYENAASLSADCVIHGIHKTLPAFTQTALLHVNGSHVNRREIKKYLSIYQTTSPSYILMAGFERCISFLETDGQQEFKRFAELLKDFYNFAQGLENIGVLKAEEAGGFNIDPSKIIIYSKNRRLTGNKLYDILLNEYNIQAEMAGGSYVLCLSSVCDTKEGFELLKRALTFIDKRQDDSSSLPAAKTPAGLIKNLRRFYCYEISGKAEKIVKLSQSGGCILAEYVYLYPPGIPLLVPGELMSIDMISQIETYKAAGLSINGIEDMSGEHIRVLA